MVQNVLRVVLGDAQTDGRPPGGADTRGGEVTVTLRDTVVAEGRTRQVDEFIAAREDRHCGATVDGHQRLPGRGQHRDLPGTESSARPERDRALWPVLTGWSNVASSITVGADPEFSGLALFPVGILDADHRVGAVRDLRTGHDSNRFARSDRAVEASPCVDHSGDREDGGLRLGGSGDVVALNRITIHRTVVPRRKLPWR